MSTMYENERDYECYDSHPVCRPYNYAPEPGRALLNVGSGGIGPMPIISTPLSRPIPVASVSIDTSNMCNPKVLLTFTSLICLPADILVNLNFILVKTVGDGSPQAIGGTHTFSEVASVLESESFSFQYCDCNPSYENTTYTVQLEPSSLIAVTAGLTITNATLSALAVETL
ncbi:DUF4489 domain-containing protein [Clostridium sp.]|uniref:DUF4489 domain-containing protein n=1 Tax=Clostridium sp. TaxID=1506 RepID=UPI00262F7A56|nr:DUF4489 domain-containing protein [Clostridium sp.]